MIKNIAIKAEKSHTENKGKSRYQNEENKLVFAEELAISYYQKNGFKAIWAENDFWWVILTVLFWDIIFAKLDGVCIKEWDFPSERQDMPNDFFSDEFYNKRERLISNRLKELEHGDISRYFINSYYNNKEKKCRTIENWEKFPSEQILNVIDIIGNEKLLSILHRLIQDFNHNRKGLPDLIVYNDSDLFFSEVKSEKDKLSKEQIEWHSFLSDSLGLNIDIFCINKTQKQIDKIMSSYSPEKHYDVEISFGYTTSKSKDEALEIMKQQPSFLIEGEGKERKHIATFNTSEVAKWNRLFRLIVTWKSSNVKAKNKEFRPVDFMTIIRCYLQKLEENKPHDYCYAYGGSQRIPFKCKEVKFYELISNKWKDYGYINTQTGEWIFDRTKIKNKVHEEIDRLDFCPLFDPKELLKLIEKIPEIINPSENPTWGYVDNDNTCWFQQRGKWISEFGDKNFPGISNMVGIEKIDRKKILEAREWAKTPISKTNNQTSGCASAIIGIIVITSLIAGGIILMI